MKNKRYFCDVYEKYQLILSIIIVIITAVLLSEGTKWVSNREYMEYESNLIDEKYVYNEDGYRMLETAIDEYIHQDGTIDIMKLRELTNGKCLITQGEDSFAILCSIDNETRLKATVSNDFKTVVKERMQTTRQEQLEEKYKEISWDNSNKMILVWCGSMVAIFATLGIAQHISSSRKKKAEKSQ